MLDRATPRPNANQAPGPNREAIQNRPDGRSTPRDVGRLTRRYGPRIAHISAFSIAVIFTPTAAAQGVLSVSRGATDGEFAGASVAGVGDLDNDGYDDVAVGCPGRPEDAAEGRVVVRSGADGSVLVESIGNPGDRLGTSVAGVGDINDDGYEDIAIGANQLDGGIYQGHRPGYVRVVSGKDGSELLLVHGDTGAEAFGQCVAAAGDANLDGVPDLVVGAPGSTSYGWHEGHGRAAVISGTSGSVIREFHAETKGDFFGRAVDGAADFNGDGSPDIVVGAYLAVGWSGKVGAAYLLSPLDGTQLRKMKGAKPNSWFGWSVAAIGDTDDDGCDDVLVGSYAESVGSSDLTGAARVYSGKTGKLRYPIFGSLPFDLFGSAVTGLPDLDGDGAADFAVGASEFCFPGDTPQPDGRGYVRIFSGRAGTVVHTNRHDQVGSGFGDSIAHVGDVNNDGKPDLIVGAPGLDGDQLDEGGAIVMAAGTEIDIGIKLAGDLNNGHADSAVFHGVKNMKVKLKALELTDGLKLRVFLFDSDGNEAIQVALKKKGAKKTIAIPSNGYWRVEVRPMEGTAGTYRLNTVRKMPQTGQEQSLFVEADGDCIRQYFHVLAGTVINIEYKVPDGFESPTLSTWKGKTQLEDTTDYVSATNKKFWLEGYPAKISGKYRFDLDGVAENAKAKVKFTPTFPEPAESEVILP